MGRNGEEAEGGEGAVRLEDAVDWGAKAAWGRLIWMFEIEGILVGMKWDNGRLKEDKG